MQSRVAKFTHQDLFAKASNALTHARPVVSGFKVGAAGIARASDGHERIVSGWNFEIKPRGLEAANQRELSADSIHAEENLVGRLQVGEWLTRVLILGQDLKPLAPCGNCREVLESASDESAEIFLQRERESEPSWQPITSLLPNQPKLELFNMASLDQSSPLRRLFHEATEQLCSGIAYTPYTPNRDYVAAVFTHSKLVFRATPREDAAYHHLHAVELAIGSADIEKQRDIAIVLFLANHPDYQGPIFPCGRCRQALKESSQMTGLPLLVAAARPSGEIWTTTIDDLLPNSFGPQDLGIDLTRFR